MKKILSIFLASFVLFPSFAVAQTIYNSSSGGGSPLYNSSGSYSGGGPISLKQMLDGNKQASVGRKNSTYYGGGNFRPYGADNNSYSLSISPQEIQESRARRDALARQRELENIAAIEGTRFIPTATDPTNGAFGFTPSSGSSGTVRRKVTSKYKQRDDNFQMPKKVFNSIY